MYFGARKRVYVGKSLMHQGGKEMGIWEEVKGPWLLLVNTDPGEFLDT